MFALQLVPVLLSTIVLAAHFWRFGQFVLFGLCLFMPALLLVPSKWMARAYQVFLSLGSVTWVIVTSDLVMERISSGAPWIRLACILGTVALATLGSAFVFQTKTMKARYN